MIHIHIRGDELAWSDTDASCHPLRADRKKQKNNTTPRRFFRWKDRKVVYFSTISREMRTHTKTKKQCKTFYTQVRSYIFLSPEEDPTGFRRTIKCVRAYEHLCVLLFMYSLLNRACDQRDGWSIAFACMWSTREWYFCLVIVMSHDIMTFDFPCANCACEKSWELFISEAFCFKTMPQSAQQDDCCGHAYIYIDNFCKFQKGLIKTLILSVKHYPKSTNY